MRYVIVEPDECDPDESDVLDIRLSGSYLQVSHHGSNDWWNVLRLTEDGKLHRCWAVPSDMGLSVKAGRIEIIDE